MANVGPLLIGLLFPFFLVLNIMCWEVDIQEVVGTAISSIVYKEAYQLSLLSLYSYLDLLYSCIYLEKNRLFTFKVDWETNNRRILFVGIELEKLYYCLYRTDIVVLQVYADFVKLISYRNVNRRLIYALIYIFVYILDYFDRGIDLDIDIS